MCLAESLICYTLNISHNFLKWCNICEKNINFLKPQEFLMEIIVTALLIRPFIHQDPCNNDWVAFLF